MKNTSVTIRFETTLYTLRQWVILPLPKDESVKLPSRGQINITGLINGHEFQTVLEPDGRWSHWVRVSIELQKAMSIRSGDTVSVEMTTSKDWPEPDVPKDLADALKIAPEKVKDKWEEITPMARWEWIRWMNATLSQQTRAIRIEKTISKLNGKHRRPCCFNLAACTDPNLSKNSQLVEPDLSISTH
ncbi:MAG: YdeI/OmpD-associated family protein [Candidatus Saccharimonadales bacterium]